MDWIIVLVIIIIIVCIPIISIQLYKLKYDKCSSDPLGYAEEVYKADCICFNNPWDSK